MEKLEAIIYQFPMTGTQLVVAETEETGAVALAVDAQGSEKVTVRSFMKVAIRDLTEEDLSTPAARRFLIAEITRLERQCDRDGTAQENCHALELKLAGLESKLESSTWQEILSFSCLSIGSVGLGAFPSYIALKDGFVDGIVIGILSVALIGVGVLSRVFKK